MSTPNGTLRLVAANPEQSAQPVGVGSPRTDASTALDAEFRKLGTAVNQLSNAALSNQLSATLTALDAFKVAVDAELAGIAASAPISSTRRLDAVTQFGAQFDNLKAMVGQLNVTSLSSQFSAVSNALDAYYRAVNAEFASYLPPKPNAPAQATSPPLSTPAQQGQMVPLSALLDAEKLIEQMKSELKKFGYTFTLSPSTNLVQLVPPTKPIAGAAGGYTTGQVGAVGVAGALLGWIGHGLWEDYEHKRGRAR